MCLTFIASARNDVIRGFPNLTITANFTSLERSNRLSPFAVLLHDPRIQRLLNMSSPHKHHSLRFSSPICPPQSTPRSFLARSTCHSALLKCTSLAVVAYLVIRLLLSGRRPPGPPTFADSWEYSSNSLGAEFSPVFPQSRLPCLVVQRLMDRFTNWAREYGPVFPLKVGSGTIIVLSEMQ